MSTNEIAFIICAIPLLLFSIFVLHIVVVRHDLVSKSEKEVVKDKPKMRSKLQTFLIMFYVLDHLGKEKGSKFMYWVGVVGVVGSTLVMMGVVIYSYIFLRLSN